MTRENLNLNSSIFLLKPQGKDYLWGGNRINDDFSKNIAMYPLAESWECSVHPDGPSVVANGVHAGQYLIDVLNKHPEYLGKSKTINGQLPILIKLIDAKEDLSVQVHPNDDYAKKNENGSLGKSEMWYVLDAKKESTLVYGFLTDMNKDKVSQALSDGSIEKYLQYVPIKKNDVFFIESGIVHAIGKGALIAEIQQNSNLTYRMYDYNRIDKQGNKRKLHIEKALDVMNMGNSLKPVQPLRVLKYKRGSASELLYRCGYFQVDRMIINTERYRKMAILSNSSSSVQIYLCISGCGVIVEENGDTMNFFKGDCFFVPANSADIKVHGRGIFLRVTC